MATHIHPLSLKIEHTLRFCPKCGADLSKRLHDGDHAANTAIDNPCMLAAGVLECVSCNLCFALQIRSIKLPNAEDSHGG